MAHLVPIFIHFLPGIVQVEPCHLACSAQELEADLAAMQHGVKRMEFTEIYEISLVEFNGT